MEHFYNYWGKAEKEGGSYHLLAYHSLDVAAVGRLFLLHDETLRNKLSAIMGMEQHISNCWMELFLALHDIGKFSITFQNLRPDLSERLQNAVSCKPYTVRHDSLGNLFFKNIMETERLCFPGWQDFSSTDWYDVIMAVVRAYTGHHGRPPQMKGLNGFPLNFRNFFTQEDFNSASEFIQNISATICCNIELLGQYDPDEFEVPVKKASWLMAGFAVVCDWIGSNAIWFPFHEDPMALEEYWEKHAIPQAERAIREAGVVNGVPITTMSKFCELFPGLSSPTPLQKFVEKCPIECSQQLFVLEDVTGSGKTEAALLLAGRLMAAGCGNGLFMALPTMATSNAMFSRLAEQTSANEQPVYLRLFEKETRPSIVLAHGARHLSEAFMAVVSDNTKDTVEKESSSAHCGSWLADNRKKALLADVGVGTLDQALLAILPSRFQSLRLFGLANHILIVDEVHAYDPYMNKLLQNLLTFHAALGGSVILLSATLPNHVRGDFTTAFARGCGDHRVLTTNNENYPLASSYSPARCLQETPVAATPQRQCTVTVRLSTDESNIISLIKEAVNKGQCVCWLRNTVHDALDGYAHLKNNLAGVEPILFHARFAMGDRLDIENTVIATFGKNSTAIARRSKVIVATQVVEQSLDLDFDLLISDLAPMDLMIQRAGRLHRHVRDETGNPLTAGPDRREPPLMVIHGPVPDDNAKGDWYKAKFEKAAFVYPNHGCLWLTARLFAERGKLIMPSDARQLIEAAFSERSNSIPEPLRQRDLQADAQRWADSSLAHINMLKLEEGYEATITQWREDMKVPTRLGGMATTVRLARWGGSTLTPWYDHLNFPWDMSQVNIPNGLVDSGKEYNGNLGKEIRKLNERLPDKGKWVVLIPLAQDQKGCWRGEAFDKRQQVVVLEYDRLTGVTVTLKEE